MSQHHIDERLSDYLDGELDSSWVREISEHLAACPSCASLLQAMKEAREILAGWPERDPSPLLLRKLVAIPASTKKTPRLRSVRDFLLRPSLQPAFAWAAGLLVFISLLIFSPQGQSLQKSLDRQIHRGYDKIGKLYAKAGSLTDEFGSYKDTVLDPLRTVGVLKKSEE